jgi:hypothetical protein
MIVQENDNEFLVSSEQEETLLYYYKVDFVLVPLP